MIEYEFVFHVTATNYIDAGKSSLPWWEEVCLNAHQFIHKNRIELTQSLHNGRLLCSDLLPFLYLKFLRKLQHGFCALMHRKPLYELCVGECN